MVNTRAAKRRAASKKKTTKRKQASKKKQSGKKASKKKQTKTKSTLDTLQPPSPPMPPPPKKNKGRKRKQASETPKRKGSKSRTKAAAKKKAPKSKRHKPNEPNEDECEELDPISDLTRSVALLNTGGPKRRARARAPKIIPLDIEEPGSPAPECQRTNFTTYNEFMQDELQTRETLRPGALKGREREHEGIQSFIVDSLKGDGTGGSLYICGSPGTGKSATMYNIHRNLEKTIREAGISYTPRIVKVCAMQCRNPQQIYPMILKALNPTSPDKSPHEACQILQKMFTTPGEKTVLIVDEIDGLLSGQVTVLYRLFEWPKQKGSNLVLIGIANSIDLTNRFLPRLQQRKAHPKLIIFRPYSAQQLTTVVKDRLGIAQDNWKNSDKPGCDEPTPDLFDTMSLMIITKKVASMYGDVRKTLEVCRECLDSIKHTDQKQVSFVVAKQVIRQMYGSKFSELLTGLPHQQQTLLVVSMVLFRTMPAADRSKIFEFYSYMTKKHSLPAVSAHLFGDMLSNLLSLGLLSEVKSSRKSRSGWVPLKCILQQDDIEMALEHNKTLTRLLQASHTVPSLFHADHVHKKYFA